MINIKAIWANHKPTGEIFIKTRIHELPHLSCFAATNHITGQHLYIMEVSTNVCIPMLKNYRFKGVEIYSIFNERSNKNELYIYLIDNELKDIFSLFIQTILDRLENCTTEEESIHVTLNVVSKWKKLFDKIQFNGLSQEQQKGLIGELLFLNYLLSHADTTSIAVNSWTSAEREFQSKDFSFGSFGVEIKFTSSNQPRIKISNERQLDTESLNKLFLVLYSTEAVKNNGFSLNSLVDQTRKKLKIEEERTLFDLKLNMNGYFDHHKEHYSKMYSLRNTFVFAITSQFPKIVKAQLPLGIYDISYSIEISSAENHLVSLDEIITNIH